MQYLRTPDYCFENLPGYEFKANYVQIEDNQGGELRVHYVDEGDKTALPILLLHGEPSWSYLYRKMIPGLVDAGFRVLAPDLIGFGRSDKPARREDYSYAAHVSWLTQWFDKLELQNTVLFCQDWGGLLGLRLVAAQPDRFAGVVAANTMLPTGDHHPGEAFLKWQAYSQSVPEFPTGDIIQRATVSELSPEVVAAYDAPYPDERYKEGARQFPLLVPVSADDPEAPANREAWLVLTQFEKPFLTAFSDQDPVTAGGDKVFQAKVPGCREQAHVTVQGGGHFLQEDKGEELAEIVIKFIASNQLNS